MKTFEAVVATIFVVIFCCAFTGIFCSILLEKPQQQTQNPPTASQELDIFYIEHDFGDKIKIYLVDQHEPLLLLCPKHLQDRSLHFHGKTIVNTQNKNIISIYQP